ncbi:MAG: 3-dehydroquinate synthase [Candidatus Aenigmatarchaeota archaeon]
MKNVHVNLRKVVDNSYDIVIEPGCLSTIAKDLKAKPLAYRHAIITDSNVGPLYGASLLKDLKGHGLNADIFYFSAGEEHKNRETKSYLEDMLTEKGFGRDTLIIALGGGVVGDLAGFVAATYDRKVPFIQVPTTLMADVDSSVGGKVAVDTPHGKNLVGAFYQPKKVYIDPNTLRTLPRQEFASGMAEVIKHAMIMDKEYFEFLEENADAINNLNVNVLVKMIKRSCEIKGKVVELDEEEENLRGVLNFGHTIGHGLEKVSNYTLPHGYGVSIGGRYAGEISAKRSLLRERELERYITLSKRFGLPTETHDVDTAELLKAMGADKKVERGQKNFVLPRTIGEMATVNGKYKIPVADNEIIDVLRL